jgi:hypothetical protein
MTGCSSASVAQLLTVDYPPGEPGSTGCPNSVALDRWLFHLRNSWIRAQVIPWRHGLPHRA